MKTKTKKSEEMFTHTYDGKIISIQGMQQSLEDFPSYSQKFIGDDGVPFLSNCVFQTTECGCEIQGNGTLQFPMRIFFCKKHRS